LKLSSRFQPAAAAALLTAAALAVATVAQAPQAVPSQQPAAGSPQPEEHDLPHPAPTNLKVLPKNLTGDQVQEIMERWEAALGAQCSACHIPDRNNIGPDGRPRLNYADDSKNEKAIARLMYTMTEEINKNYVAKIDSSGAPVTCGTCHRGHLGPEPFVAPAGKPNRSRSPQSPMETPPPSGENGPQAK
jgi:mono/diheme cytochrome c family protein